MKLYLDNPEIGKSFEAVKISLPGADMPGMNDLRSKAMTRFSKVGIPGPKVEEWKYTNLTFLANENFITAAKADHQQEVRQYFNQVLLKKTPGAIMVFVNGYFYGDLSSLSDEEGLSISVFSQNPQAFHRSLLPASESTSLNDLNRAMATDGYRVEIAADVTLRQPVQIIHIATSSTHMRCLRTRARIRLGRGARASFTESFIGPEDARYWFHMITDVTLDKGAEASFAQFQLQGSKALHMTEFHSRLSDRAALNHISLQLGAEISRTELVNSFTGEDARVKLCGAYLGRNRQSHDIFTRINHDRPGCRSRQLFRGVLDKGGKSAFQGKVVVARQAQKTNADQSAKTLLLDRGAEANAKPELLIYADDVKCSHGATVGEVDADQLFYLRSRGLDEIAAKSLLVEAFVSGVFDDVEDKILADKFTKHAADWLQKKAMS